MGIRLLKIAPGIRRPVTGRLRRNLSLHSTVGGAQALTLLVGESGCVYTSGFDSLEGGGGGNQQQRIRTSRLENEAPSGIRIVFCFTMLIPHDEYHFPSRVSIRGPFVFRANGRPCCCVNCPQDPKCDC